MLLFALPPERLDVDVVDDVDSSVVPRVDVVDRAVSVVCPRPPPSPSEARL